MSKSRKALAVLVAIVALATVAHAVGASVEVVSMVPSPAGTVMTTYSTGAPLGSYVQGYMVNPETQAAFLVSASPVVPLLGTSVLNFPPAATHYRVDLRSQNGTLLASISGPLGEFVNW